MVVQSKTMSEQYQGEDRRRKTRTKRMEKGIFTSVMMILTVLMVFRMKGEYGLLSLHTSHLEKHYSYVMKKADDAVPPIHLPVGHPPIPSAYIYTKELYTAQQNELRNNTNDTVVTMNPVVYERLTNKINEIKHARKPLLIKVHSHPCAGKTFFISKNNSTFMGCTLRDHDALGNGYKGLKDSSYLRSDGIKGNTAMLGLTYHWDIKKYEDVVYIYVLPPLTIVEGNVKKRQEQDRIRSNGKWGLGKYSRLGPVTDKRRESLNYAIKDEMLVEPLFATFEEGLEFCINTYNNADVRVEDGQGEEMANNTIHVGM